MIRKHPPDGSHPPGYAEHRKEFSADGSYGKWIVNHDAVIKINDTLFLHGGISAKYVSTKIREINEKVWQELKGDRGNLSLGPALIGTIRTDLVQAMLLSRQERWWYDLQPTGCLRNSSLATARASI